LRGCFDRKSTFKSVVSKTFTLSNSNDSVLRDMGEWRDEIWNWKIPWRRDRFVWEDE